MYPVILVFLFGLTTITLTINHLLELDHRHAMLLSRSWNYSDYHSRHTQLGSQL